ncbi:beta strand repeat-containing protein [Patescibacteria group bacterium]
MFKIKTKNQLILKILLLAAVLFCVLYLGAGVFAQADVDIDITAGDPDCHWSGGPGTELYVPSGKTCTITSNTTAADVPLTFTGYGVIVYPGGTLNINDGVTLSVTDTIYNAGIINVGSGGAHASDARLQTVGAFGRIDMIDNAAAALNVTNNSGTGNNYISVSQDLNIGSASLANTPTLTIDSSATNHTVTGKVNVYGHADINAGTTTVGSVEVYDVAGGSSEVNIAGGATLTTNLYYTNTLDLALGIGNRGTSGTAAVNVSGILNIPLYGANDIFVMIGSFGTTDAKLHVKAGGDVNINETSTFAVPGDPTTAASNGLIVFCLDPLWGLIVEGTFDTAMYFANYGQTTVTGGSGILNAHDHYIQDSALNVGAGDTMTITGTADIDGDAQIDGTLTVSDCTKIRNGAAESFDIGAAGEFTTGDATCPLTNTGSTDGLNVQGTNTTMTIADNAGATQPLDITGDFSVANSANAGGNVDADGYFTATGDLIVNNAGAVSLSDGTDNFEVNELYIYPGANNATVTVESTGELDLTGDEVILGVIGVAGVGTLSVAGAFFQSATSSDNFTIEDQGKLEVTNTGDANLVALVPGQITVKDGGTIDTDGRIDIFEQELEMNGTNASIIVNDEGLIDSTAVFGTGPAFDYNGGDLTIQDGTTGTTNGAMKFDDEIDIDTAGDMQIDGYLEGTNLIDFNGTGTVSKIGSSGEMKVLVTDSKIYIHQDLDLFGKLNAADGDGDITIYGASTPAVGGGGISGDTSYTYVLARDLNIELGAEINVSSLYESYDPGGAETYGGSYGGEGLGGTTSTFGATKYFTAPSYSGTANPVGMYGYNSGGAVVASGGGGAYIEVHRDLTVNGNIKANGDESPSDNSGGGSGGLIVINHNIIHSDTGADFTGSGTIEANGGDGTAGTSRFGGGGGRIVISSILFDDPDDGEPGPPGNEPHYQFDGTIQAKGGSTNGGTTTYAAAGTIVYLADDNNPNDTLIVDQGNLPLGAGGAVTEIPNTGDTVFDRIEARKGADIEFVTWSATNPVSCLQHAAAAIDLGAGGTCTANPDKPDVGHINNSYTGAQLGDEPWWNSTVTVGDKTPAFSAYYRNRDYTNPTSDYILIEVDDTDATFGSLVWSAADANNPVQLSSSASDGDRIEDIEYGGAALTPGNTYYVRMAFSNSSGLTRADRGLWTHLDMGNHYQFDIASTYMEITNACSDLIEVVDTNAGGRAVGQPLKNSQYDRYGEDTCDFTINSTDTSWKVYYSMAPTITDMEDSSDTFTFAAIVNPSDYQMDSTGDNTYIEEEYGFHIDDISGTSAYIQADTETGTHDYDDWTPGTTGQYVFDIETDASKDKILDGGGGTITGGQFRLYIHGGVDDFTVGATYDLDTWMVITGTP